MVLSYLLKKEHRASVYLPVSNPRGLVEERWLRTWVQKTLMMSSVISETAQHCFSMEIFYWFVTTCVMMARGEEHCPRSWTVFT